MRNHKKKEMRLPIINGTHMRVSNYFDYLYNGYGFVNSSNSCVRKKLFDEIGFFKTMKLGSDFDMWCRILEKYSLAIYFVESVQINLDAENRVSIRYVGEIPPFIMELKKRIVDEHIVESRCLSVNRYLNLLITKQVIHMLLNGNIIESKKLYSERVDLDELHLYEKIMNIIIYFPSKILGIGVFILNKIGFIGYLYRKSFR